MSESFQPSVESARGALGEKIDYREHPVGLRGASISLEEVARRIREGRLDPRVRAWAGEVLIKAGKPKAVIDQAQALLDAVRSKTMYLPDPVGAEFVVAAKNTLCLDKEGLCIPAGDCDDRAVALGSALMSVGIPVKVIGQAFKGENVPSHVMLGIKGPFGLKRIEPSDDTYKVGQSHPAATREWILDPMDQKPVNLVGMHGSDPKMGEFVGIGQTPAAVDAVTSQLQSVIFSLQKSNNELATALNQIQQTRSLLRGPNSIYDPEPFSVTSLADFPASGIWTQSMQSISLSIWSTADKIIQAGHEALAGTRKLFVDEQTQDTYIEAVPSDTWRLSTIAHKATDVIVGIYDSAANLVGGIVSTNGKTLTKEQADAEVAKSQLGTVHGVGAIQLVPILWAAGVAIVSVSICFIVQRWADAAKTIAREATNREIIQCVANGSCTQQRGKELLQAVSDARQNEAKADAENNKADPFHVADFGQLVKWLAIGGVVVFGVVTLSPLVSEFAKSAAESHRTKRLARA